MGKKVDQNNCNLPMIANNVHVFNSFLFSITISKPAVEPGDVCKVWYLSIPLENIGVCGGSRKRPVARNGWSKITHFPAI